MGVCRYGNVRHGLGSGSQGGNVAEHAVVHVTVRYKLIAQQQVCPVQDLQLLQHWMPHVVWQAQAVWPRAVVKGEVLCCPALGSCQPPGRWAQLSPGLLRPACTDCV